MCCHPEPMRFAQGKLREGSLSTGKEILRSAQHDSTDLGWKKIIAPIWGAKRTVPWDDLDA